MNEIDYLCCIKYNADMFSVGGASRVNIHLLICAPDQREETNKRLDIMLYLLEIIE